ncbi:MAG: agmatinase family protein [Chitinophagales bacterium]
MMTEKKKIKINAFNANELAASDAQIFGLPFDEEESEVILLPVPWEVTVSYKTGAAKGFSAIYDASMQVDLYDEDLPDAWKHGIFMKKNSAAWKQKNSKMRKLAAAYLENLSEGKISEQDKKTVYEINTTCEKLNSWVKEQCVEILEKNKFLGLVGGDHSTPLGLYHALAEKYSDFGILHIDAHADLRDAYEGFTYSHSSIMFHALKISQLKKLVQVGLRDVCEAEVDIIKNSNRRVIAFYDSEMKKALYEGISWKTICENIIQNLPQHVHISFDIDGLDPKNCPNTGTPVPGGLEYEQTIYLFRRLVESGRQIIGFDLVEVAPGKDEWDANVGARVLYKLCNLLVKSGVSVS